jgi:hypothetical protein
MPDLIHELDTLIGDSQKADSAPPQDKLEQITELLGGKEFPEEGTGADQGGDANTGKEAQDDTKAETQDGIDYSAEVPMSDGSKVTLGALKDAYQDSQRNVLQLQERENALMQKYDEVNQLSQHVQLPPQALEAIRQQQQQYLQQQHQLMLQVMPELGDQAVFTATKEGIMSLAKEYGVVDIVAGVSDHRVVKMLRDFANLRSSIRTAKENVKPLRSTEPAGKNKPASQGNPAERAAARARSTNRHADRIEAISALLK